MPGVTMALLYTVPLRYHNFYSFLFACLSVFVTVNCKPIMVGGINFQKHSLLLSGGGLDLSPVTAALAQPLSLADAIRTEFDVCYLRAEASRVSTWLVLFSFPWQCLNRGCPISLGPGGKVAWS